MDPTKQPEPSKIPVNPAATGTAAAQTGQPATTNPGASGPTNPNGAAAPLNAGSALPTAGTSAFKNGYNGIPMSSVPDDIGHPNYRPMR